MPFALAFALLLGEGGTTTNWRVWQKDRVGPSHDKDIKAVDKSVNEWPILINPRYPQSTTQRLSQLGWLQLSLVLKESWVSHQVDVTVTRTKVRVAHVI